MAFYSYEGVPDSILDKQHKTSTGETYSLRHNENLKVEMQFLGKGNSKANSQGWERDNSKYFDALYNNHPEMFSKKNVIRMKEGHAPIVDQKMISSNPAWAKFRNQPLIHHHIGGNGEAVAIPQNAHKGQGEIHNHEKAAGITDNCRSFSKKCASNPDSIGKTTSQLHTNIGVNASVNVKSNKNPSSSKNNLSRPTIINQSSQLRGDAVRNVITSKQATYLNGRSQTVRNADRTSNTKSFSHRSDSVKNSLQNNGTIAKSSSGNTNSNAAKISKEPKYTGCKPSSGASNMNSSGQHK